MSETVIKPGAKTSEFYKSVVLELIAIAVAIGLISPSQSELLKDLPNAVALGIDVALRIAGLLTAVISQWNYTKSRTQIKTASKETECK